jgi:recombinational DNA repair protein (RecF pathway)
VLCEITAATVREEQPEHATFRLLGAVLTALEGGLHPWLAVRYAEYWTLKLHGVLPDLTHCSACGEPFPERGARWAVGGVGLLCRRCPKPERTVAFRSADLAALAAFDRHPPHALDIPLDVARPQGPLETLLRGSLEAFAERTFRSYRHLRAATTKSA